MIVISRDAHQLGQSSDITINVNNHINVHFPSQALDNNHVRTAVLDVDREHENHDEKVTDEDDADEKRITDDKSNDSDHSSNYQTPITSDDENETNN